MKANVNLDGNMYQADFSNPLDISIPLIDQAPGPKCFHAPSVSINPVVAGEWIGSTLEGAAVNFKNVLLNPHGNGTHTECVGHISTEIVNINEVLTHPIFTAQLCSISPDKLANGDHVITEKHIKSVGLTSDVTGLIIRTLPNDDSKLTKDYSDTNPPYFAPEAIDYLVSQGIIHLLIDLPSVDRESDDGRLSSHKTFWNYPNILDTKKTITEMIYVDQEIPDGPYLCDLHIINLAMDASPSRPILYELKIST